MHVSAIIRRLSSIALLPTLWLVLAVPAAAQAPGTSYRVSDIAVRAEAADAVQAQAIAIDRGQREGLATLIERLSGGAGQGAPSLEGRSIDELVSSFEVLSETVGPGSYAGTIAVTYDREAVEGLLRDRGLGFVREAPPPAVLVPLWETGAGVRLWERDNLWKEAFDRALADDALARFIVPLGDLQDLALLDPDQALRGDEAAMQRLAARYGASEVVVARLRGSGAPGTPLEMEARRFGGPSEPAYRSVVRRSGEESLEVSLSRAARELQAAFDQRIRDRMTVPAGPREMLVVIAPVEDLVSWGQLLGQIEALVEVESASVRRLTRREATLDLQVAGGIDRLRESLGRSGWNLTDNEGNRWRLQRGGQAGTPQAPSPL
jgi:hypothetical protein